MAREILNFEGSVNAYYAGMQQVAKAKVSGSYIKGQVPQSVFKPSIELWMATRTAPSLIPYIDGNPATIDAYEDFIRKNIYNLAEIYKRVSLRPGSGKDSYQWNAIVAAHSRVTGSAKNISAYEKTIEDTYLFVVSTPELPYEPIDGYAIDQLRKYLKDNNLTAPGGGKFKFLVVYEPKVSDNPNIAVVSFAKCLVKQEDGTYKGTIGGYRYTYENVYGFEKDKSPLGTVNVVPQTDPNPNKVFFDIEHLTSSVASENIEGIIRGLKAVKAKAEKDLQSSNPTTKSIAAQIVKDLEEQISNAEVNLIASKKVGRILSDILPQNITTKEFKKLVDRLPVQDAYSGMNLLFYDETTQNFDLTKVQVTHTVEAEFMPGLSKFNRGVASALEKIASQTVIDAALNPASPSPFTTLLFGVLAKTFKEKKLADKIRKEAKGGRKFRGKVFIPILKKGASNKLRKPNVGLSNKTLQAKRSRVVSRGGSPGGAASQTTKSLLALLNRYIREYVIQEMSAPSLVNRTGRFASSVRILSAQEDQAVQYTYRKSPYQVFSVSRGKTPWATTDRDPAKIIDTAIRKIGVEKFGKVLRTEEV